MPNRFERRIGKDLDVGSKIIRQNVVENDIQTNKKQIVNQRRVSSAGIKENVKKFTTSELYNINNYMKLELMYLKHKVNTLGGGEVVNTKEQTEKTLSQLKVEVEKIQNDLQAKIDEEVKKINSTLEVKMKEVDTKTEKLNDISVEKSSKNNNTDMQKIVDELKSDLEGELKKIKGIFPRYDNLIAGFDEKFNDIHGNINHRFEQSSQENEKILKAFYSLDMESIKNIREEYNTNFTKMCDIESQMKSFKKIIEKFDMNKMKEIERNIRINTDLINEYKSYMNQTIVSNENLTKNNEFFQKEINRLNTNMTEVLSTLSEMKEEGVQYFIKHSNKKQNYNNTLKAENDEKEYLKNEQEKAKKKEERNERLKNKNFKGMALARVLEQRKHAKAKQLIK